MQKSELLIHLHSQNNCIIIEAKFNLMKQIMSKKMMLSLLAMLSISAFTLNSCGEKTEAPAETTAPAVEAPAPAAAAPVESAPAPSAAEAPATTPDDSGDTKTLDGTIKKPPVNK
jgi:hypothetical protein